MKTTVFILLLVVHWAPAKAQFSFMPAPAKEDSAALVQLFEKGRLDAQRDVRQGKLMIKWFSLHEPWHDLFKSLSKKEFGILIDFGPDLVVPEDNAYWSGYNGIVYQEIKRRFGKDIIDKVYDEAIQTYNRTHPGRMPLNREVLEQVQYTEAARQDSVEGLVIVGFDLASTGVPENVKIIRGLGYGLDEEALRVTKLLRFKPAEDIENAQPLKMLVLPVRFQLREN